MDINPLDTLKVQGGSVYIFGLGIRTVSHITLESNFLLQKMELVFYSNTDSRINEYLKSLGSKGVNLSDLYIEGKQREQVYQEICDAVIKTANSGVRCAYLAGGNPIFLNTVVIKLREAAMQNGIPIFLYPGVSSIDTILNDIFLPIGDTGLQCYEATHFVRMKPNIDLHVPLLLFQPGVVEALDIHKPESVNVSGVKVLQDILIQLYGYNQEWIVVGSATSNESCGIIGTGLLSELTSKAHLLAMGTLLISVDWKLPYDKLENTNC